MINKVGCNTSSVKKTKFQNSANLSFNGISPATFEKRVAWFYKSLLSDQRKFQTKDWFAKVTENKPLKQDEIKIFDAVQQRALRRLNLEGAAVLERSLSKLQGHHSPKILLPDNQRNQPAMISQAFVNLQNKVKSIDLSKFSAHSSRQILIPDHHPAMLFRLLTGIQNGLRAVSCLF